MYTITCKIEDDKIRKIFWNRLDKCVRFFQKSNKIKNSNPIKIEPLPEDSNTVVIKFGYENFIDSPLFHTFDLIPVFNFYQNEYATEEDYKRSPSGNRYEIIIKVEGDDSRMVYPDNTSIMELLHYIFLAKDEYVYQEVILSNDDDVVTLLIGMETNIYLDIGMMPCRISSKEREENK